MLSQVLTLYTTPVVYLYLGRLGRLFQRGRVQPETATIGQRIPYEKHPHAAEIG